MNEKKSITFRIDVGLIRALKVQAATNNRSANGECVSILEDALSATKKALESHQASSNASNN